MIINAKYRLFQKKIEYLDIKTGRNRYPYIDLKIAVIDYGASFWKIFLIFRNITAIHWLIIFVVYMLPYILQ